MTILPVTDHFRGFEARCRGLQLSQYQVFLFYAHILYQVYL